MMKKKKSPFLDQGRPISHTENEILLCSRKLRTASPSRVLLSNHWTQALHQVTKSSITEIHILVSHGPSYSCLGANVGLRALKIYQNQQPRKKYKTFSENCLYKLALTPSSHTAHIFTLPKNNEFQDNTDCSRI